MSEKQRWNAARYQKHAAFVPALGQPVLELLAPQPGERILDLGCGEGALTAVLAEAGAEVVGVDASPELVEAAQARGVDARLGSGEALTFHEEFDAVFSNAALHWMPQADRVIAGVARALKPGGRFVGEMGGHGNVAAIVTALHAALWERGREFGSVYPWYFPTAEAYAAKLEAAGFSVGQASLIPRPTPLPTGVKGWLGTFAQPFLARIDEREQAAVLSEVETLLAPSLRDEAGRWMADYVRLRFAAVKNFR